MKKFGHFENYLEHSKFYKILRNFVQNDTFRKLKNGKQCAKLYNYGQKNKPALILFSYYFLSMTVVKINYIAVDSLGLQCFLCQPRKSTFFNMAVTESDLDLNIHNFLMALRQCFWF